MRDAVNDEEQSGRQFTLLACGSNSGGQLGIGHVEDAHRWQVCQAHDGSRFPPAGWSVEQLSSGAAHTAVITKRKDGRHPVQRAVWVCGSNTQGQLGPQFADGENLTTLRPLDLGIFMRNVNHREAFDSADWSVRLVQCGWDWTMLAMKHNEGVKDDILLIAAGPSNDFGQYGLGKDWRKAAPSTDRIDYRGALLESPLLSSSSLRWQIKRISCGLRHILILCRAKEGQENGKQVYALIGWGATKHGQVVPAETVRTNSVQANTRFARLADRKAAVWQPKLVQAWTCDEAQYGDSTAFLATGKEHSALCVPAHWQPIENGSLSHDESSLALRLHLFGSNEKRQLDVRSQLLALHGSADPQASEVSGLDCTWNATVVAVRKTASDDQNPQGANRIYASGNNSKGQLGGLTSGSSLAGRTDGAVDFACGSEHVVVLSASPSAHSHPTTRVQGWGWNEHGNLAQGDVEDRHTSVLLWPPPEPTSSIVHSLGDTSAATHVFAGNATTYLQVCTHRNV